MSTPSTRPNRNSLKRKSTNRAISTLPIPTNKREIVRPTVFDFYVSIDKMLAATKEENVSVLTKQRNEALSLDSFINYSIGFIGEANSRDSQDRFIRLFLNNIGQGQFASKTEDSKIYGNIYLRTIESNKLKILFNSIKINRKKLSKIITNKRRIYKDISFCNRKYSGLYR